MLDFIFIMRDIFLKKPGRNYLLRLFMRDENNLSIKKASAYLQIDQKALDNYIKGQEIPFLKVGRIRKVTKSDLDTWKHHFDDTTVILNQDHYFKALRFALKK